MKATAHPLPTGVMSPFDQIRYAREVILMESQALELITTRLDTEFCRAADAIFACEGNIIVSGIGKAGLIGQKLTATLASTGTKAHYLHPAEAIHGDLGRVDSRDIVLMLSQSGETEEVTRILPSLRSADVPIIAITARRSSSLGKASAIVLELGPLREACALGVAPSTSTTAMLALGDALALVVSRMRAFSQEDFHRFHPGGALGRKLAKVEDAMRPLDDCRVTRCGQTVREIFATTKMPRRRTGAIMIVDPQGILRGIFTDSDLARLFESRRDDLLDQSIREVMTKRPRCVPLGAMLSDALEILAERKISELPVVDDDGRPVGMIDITDVLGLFPEQVRQTIGERTLSVSSGDALQSSVITSPLPISMPAPHFGLHDEPTAGTFGGGSSWISAAHPTPVNIAIAMAQQTAAAEAPKQAPIPRPNARFFGSPNSNHVHG